LLGLPEGQNSNGDGESFIGNGLGSFDDLPRLDHRAFFEQVE